VEGVYEGYKYLHPHR